MLDTSKKKIDDDKRLKKKKKNKNTDNNSNNDYTIDEDEKELLLLSRSKKENDTLTPEQRKIYDKTRRVIVIYSRFIYIHAFLVEGPISIIEGIIRFAIFFGLGSIFLLLSFFTLKWLKLYSILFIRESLLTLSAITTIALLPGSVMSIYRRYHDENDWDLAPLPTIMGWVDTRRFITFTHGNGSSAKNVKVKDNNKNKKKKTNNDNEIYSNLLAIDHKCQDSCSKVIIFAPRVVSSFLLKITKGEDVEIPFLEDDDYDNDDEYNDKIENENNNDNNI